MKEALALIQFALLLMKAVNWIMGRIDKAAWEASGYKKAMADQAAILRQTLVIAEVVKAEVAKKTDAEVLKELEANGEIRD